jgi:hypothetical protein
MSRKQLIASFAILLLLGAVRFGGLWYRWNARGDQYDRRHATRECKKVMRENAWQRSHSLKDPPLDDAEIERCMPIAIGCAREAAARPPIVKNGMTLTQPEFEYDGEALCVQARLKNPSAPFPNVVVP